MAIMVKTVLAFTTGRHAEAEIAAGSSSEL